VPQCPIAGDANDKETDKNEQWRRHTRCVRCVRTPIRNYIIFLYLISELFESVVPVCKTCSCSIVKLVPPDASF